MASKVGSCTLNKALFADPITTPDCDNFSPTQYTNQGCGVTEETDLWGNSKGGVCKYRIFLDHCGCV